MGNIVRLKMRKRFSSRSVVYVILYDNSQDKFVCDYGLFEYSSIPCRHIICAMKSENINDFPATLIFKRWLKSVMVDYMYSIPTIDLDAKKHQMLQRGALAGACNILTEVAFDNVANFVSVIEDVYKLVSKFQKRRNPSSNGNTAFINVQDPIFVKARGR